MKIESHIENLKESLREIEEAINTGLTLKQRTLGFHLSAACADMIEMILHKQNIVDPGFIFKHEWINSKNMLEEKLAMDFPKKEEILGIARKIENNRNSLCYGKRKSEEELAELIEDFNKLKDIFLGVFGNEL